MDTPPPAPAASTEDNTVAIVSYLTFIGFIAAIIIHGNKKTALGAFHLRQTLGLILTAIPVWISIMVLAVVLAFIPVIGPLMIMLIWACFALSMLGLWIMGFIGAINKSMTPVPVVGPLYQKWFANAFT